MTQAGWMYKPRSFWLERLQKETFDLIIIGGGITGAGIAREAVLAGWRVALLEAHDFASGTSSRSTKLVHGGLRYLAQGEVRLVRETGQERAVLHKLAPHLVEPMPFLLPIYDGMQHGLRAMSFAVWLYDRLARVKKAERRRVLTGAELEQLHTSLRAEGLRGGVLYHEYLTDDARLTLATLQSASEWGAVVLNDCPVQGLLYSKEATGEASTTRTEDKIPSDEASGAKRIHTDAIPKNSDAPPAPRMCGVRALDRTTGRMIQVYGHVIVNAAGPWIEEVLAMDTGVASMDTGVASVVGNVGEDHNKNTATASPATRITHSLGIHLAFSAERLPLPHALAVQTPDRRLIFLIPKRDITYVGTTDKRYQGDLTHPNVPPEDVDYLLGLTNELLTSAHLTQEDIIGTWSGVRPLVKQGDNPEQKATQDVSREDEIWISPHGLVTIAGGKLTAFRKMAERVIEKVRPLLPPSTALKRSAEGARLAVWKRRPVLSASLPLYGAKEIPWQDTDGWRAREAKWLMETYRLGKEDSLALLHRYGDCAKAVLVYADENTPGAHLPFERVVPEIAFLEAEIPYLVGVEMAYHVADVISRRTELGRFRGKELRALILAVAERMQRLLGWSEEVRNAEVESCLRECHLS